MPILKTPGISAAGGKGGLRPSPVRHARPKASTAKALLKHAGSWVGGDLEARLAEVYSSRARASF
jgi:hypothetical protein